MVQIGSYSSSTLPSFTEGDKNVLSLKLLSESRSLCVILAGGDIVTLALEGGEGEKVSSLESLSFRSLEKVAIDLFGALSGGAG